MDTYENQEPMVPGTEPEQSAAPMDDVEIQPVDQTPESVVEETVLEGEVEAPVQEQVKPDPQPVGPAVVDARPQYDQFPPKHEKKKTGKGWKAVVAVILALVLVIASASATAGVLNISWQKEKAALLQSMNERIEAVRKELADNQLTAGGNSVSGTPNTTPDGSLTPAQVYAKHVASVVSVQIGNSYGQSVPNGSGFILTADGYVVTNYHVVNGASSLSVVCYDGKEYPATFVGGDENNDVAVLRAQAEGLQPAVIGRSDHLIVGDQVVAIGNPMGDLEFTMTVGYVSAKDRLINTDGTEQNMIQTDAALNPGNSGGPLFNMKGEVIGITTAKRTGVSSSGTTIEGIGFAIPMDDVIGMLTDIMEKGYVSGAYLGVTGSNVSQTENQLYGIPLGVWITSVVDGSCAQKGGIRVRDVITNLGGYDVTSANELGRVLRNFKPGDTVSCTVFRISSGTVNLTLTLDERPAPDQQTSSSTQTPSSGSSDSWFDYFFPNS